MNDSSTLAVSPNRRDMLKIGTTGLAALAGLGMASSIRAQAGTPEVGSPQATTSLFGVTRSYVVKDDEDVNELIAIVQEFADIISATPGFIAYNVIFDETTRGYSTIGFFDSQEASEASNEAAAEHRAENDVSRFFVDPEPVIVQGQIVISTGM